MVAQYSSLKGYGVLFGIILALFVAIVIYGGVKSIGKVTSTLVPFMAILYISVSILIIFYNITRIGEVTKLIFYGAFNPPAMKGGFIGVMVIGLRRAAFSNEAGVGSAAIAHSAAKTKYPAAEGIVALHEPLIDTVLICTMTALVLIFTGFHASAEGLQGAAITSAAFGSVFPWFPFLLMIAIILFSFSTLLSFAYYGQKCFDYCFGGLFEKLTGYRAIGIHFYRILFLSATVLGASSSVKTVMNYSDIIIFGLVFTNTLGLFLLSGEIREELDLYQQGLRDGTITKCISKK